MELEEQLKDEFVKSWNHVETFYNNLSYDKLKEITAFIAAIREKGYDKQLRAGTSMYSLIISRSRGHGLRYEQQSIHFSFDDYAGKIEVLYHRNKVFLLNTLELDNKVEVLLLQLLEQPID